MTSFDLQSAFSVPADWPDYSEEVVNITTALHLNDNGTVTIVYHDVPWLDVDDLLVQMGSPEGRAQLLEALAETISETYQELAEGMPIPFEVTNLA